MKNADNKCENCNGLGHLTHHRFEPEVCQKCNGTGNKPRPKPPQDGLAFVVPVNNALFALGAEINEINRGNGWDVLKPEEWPESTDDDETQKRKTRKLGTVIALIHSEASEALEALRHRDRLNFEEELADVMIRILDCSHGLGIDIGKVVQEKLAKNRTRGFRHGGKAV